MKRMNEWLAKKTTLIFGTMWMFYAFFIYGLLPVIPELKPYESEFFYWSGWIQLWALPLLMVGQNVLGRASEAREQETHDAVMQELEMIKETLDLANEERERMKQIIEKLNLNVRCLNERIRR